MRHWNLATDCATWELFFALALWLLYVLRSSVFYRSANWLRILAASTLLWLFIAPYASTIQETRAPVAIVLDDSASMARPLDDTTVYASAKELAKTAQEAARAANVSVSARALSGSNADAPNAPTSPLSSVLSLDGLVFLLTDGIENTTDAIPKNALNSRTIVAPIVVGSSRPLFDWRWENIPSSSAVYPKEQARLRGSLRLFGSETPRSAVVSLWDTDADKLLWQTTFESAGDAIELDYTWDPPRDAPSRYRLEVDDAEDSKKIESKNLDHSRFLEFCRANNFVEFSIVPSEKKLSVLLVDDQPRYEYRYMRAMLQREETVDLRVLLFSADPRLTAEDERAITIDEIDRETIKGFDVVLIGDVPDELWQDKFRHIVDVVLKDEQAPAIWFLGGAVGDSRLAPGELVDDALPQQNLFHIGSTAEGRRVFGELADAPTKIELTRITPYVAPTSVTQVLFVAKDAQSTPLFAIVERGSTKVAWQGFDELWRLQTLDDKTLYRRFVMKTLEYLSAQISGAELDAAFDALQRDEKEDVAAKLDFAERLAAQTHGAVLDLRDTTLEESRRQTREFVSRLIAESPTVTSEKKIHLAPNRVFIPLALVLFLLAWAPNALWRKSKRRAR
ncbi:MAG: hypothetical protein PHO46_10960 [Thermoguttaceae bacterium]|jgi:hypothetical protein|nr:hypothetical protein [Thermoguttaceae bacterium]